VGDRMGPPRPGHGVHAEPAGQAFDRPPAAALLEQGHVGRLLRQDVPHRAQAGPEGPDVVGGQPETHAREATRTYSRTGRRASPAPYCSSPWVSVGPSSITRTRLPARSAPSSRVTGLRPRMSRAPGFSSAAAASMATTCSGVAESTLLMTMASAIRKLVSPGW